MRGLRCHPMYCRSSTRMQIVPLLASRAQALRYCFCFQLGDSVPFFFTYSNAIWLYTMFCLIVNRYLFVRWRLNVANVYVFLGESGDTDYEEMIAGTHKTIIMKGFWRAAKNIRKLCERRHCSSSEPIGRHCKWASSNSWWDCDCFEASQQICCWNVITMSLEPELCTLRRNKIKAENQWNPSKHGLVLTTKNAASQLVLTSHK